MRKTGSALAILVAAVPALVLAAAPTPTVTQEVDRTEVGTEDIFVLTVRATDVPSGSSLQLADMPTVETIGTSRSTETSIRVDSSGPRVQQISTLRVRMRAQKPGKLVLAPSELHTSSGVFRSQPLTLTVKGVDTAGGINTTHLEVPLE